MNDLLKKGYDVLDRLFAQKKAALSSYRCCIDINHEEILLSYGVQKTNTLEFQGCDTIAYQSNQLPQALASIVQRYSLKQASCTWILRPDYYQLLSIDALLVPPEEMREALYWKIKPLIQFPMDRAVYDYFLLPPPKTASTLNLMTVVVADRLYLKPMAHLIQKSGLVLNSINIPELVLKKNASLYEEGEKSAALIYLQDQITYLIITHNQTLYMSRQLELNLKTLQPKDANFNEQMDKFALELQRSFDYFQARFRLPPPAHCLIASSYASATDISHVLLQRLPIHIDVLDVNAALKSRRHLSIEEQGKYLTVLSEMLKGKIEIYATAD